MRKKDKKTLMVILLSIVLLTVSFAYLYYNLNLGFSEIKTLPMSLKVSDVIGFNVGTDAIYFGKTKPGGTSKREVNIENNYDFPVSVSIKIRGDIEEYVSVSENNFKLAEGEKKQISFYAQTQKDTPEGNYTGETDVVFKRVLI